MHRSVPDKHSVVQLLIHSLTGHHSVRRNGTHGNGREHGLKKQQRGKTKGVWWVAGGPDRLNMAGRVYFVKKKKEKPPAAQLWIMWGTLCYRDCKNKQNKLSLWRHSAAAGEKWGQVFCPLPVYLEAIVKVQLSETFIKPVFNVKQTHKWPEKENWGIKTTTESCCFDPKNNHSIKTKDVLSPATSMNQNYTACNGSLFTNWLYVPGNTFS